VPIPPGQTEAVLAASRACTDPAQARLLASLLERAAPSLPPASLASLSDAPDGIIRRLAGTAAGPAPR
jgi:hypothetical protein